MRIVMPVWNGRVSPLLDCAREFVIVDYDESEETARHTEVCAEEAAEVRAARLAGMEASSVICGAVSELLARLLAGKGVRVLAWVSGEAEEVLAAFRAGTLRGSGFVMPGCGRAMKRYGGRGGRGGRGQCGWNQRNEGRQMRGGRP